MTSTTGRKRLLVLFGLQIIFAAIVTLAALAFLAAGSANGNDEIASWMPGDNVQSAGRIETRTIIFNPAQISPSNYND